MKLAILLAAFSLGACSKPNVDQIAAKCEVAAREHAPPKDTADMSSLDSTMEKDLYPKSGPAADYAQACMKAAGYEFQYSPACPMGYESRWSLFEGRCYHPL